jgi:hypothetical protein
MSARGLAAVLAALTLVPSLAQAAPGDCRLIRGAETPDVTTDDTSVCRQDVWFHDSGTKAGNLAASGEVAGPTWNTTKPTTAATAGAGGGYFQNSVTEIVTAEFGEESGPTFSGSFTGDIDSIAMDLFVLDPRRTATSDTGTVRVKLEIDGMQVYADAEATDVKASPAGNLRRVQVAYTDVFEALKGSGVVTGPAQQHTVRVSVLVFYFGDEQIIFYDAAEAPSGLIFNHEDPAAAGYTAIDIWEDFE